MAECGAWQVRFAMRHFPDRPPEFMSATLNGRPVAPPSLRRVAQAVGELEAVYSVEVQCTSAHVTLVMLTKWRGRQAYLEVVWVGNELRPNRPSPATFFPQER
jgi:hypothetical protein